MSSAVVMAFKKECSAFDHTISAVQTATANDVNVGELLTTMTAHGDVETTWNKQLESTSKEPDVLGVPIGNNQARSLASKIGRVAVDLAELTLEADIASGGTLNNIGSPDKALRKIKPTWNKLQRTIQAVRNLGCS
jgi:hypothetical protein